MPANIGPAGSMVPGGSQALQEAISSRTQGGQTPPLGQTSAQALARPPEPSLSGAQLPSPQGSQPDATGAQVKPPETENEMIIKGLLDYMKMKEKANQQSQAMQIPGGILGAGGGKGQDYVSHKMPILMHEGKTQQQALGQAYGMARQKGYRP